MRDWYIWWQIHFQRAGKPYSFKIQWKMESGKRWNVMLSQKRKYKKWLLYYFDNTFMSNDRTPMDKKMYIIGINKKQFKTLFYQ